MLKIRTWGELLDELDDKRSHLELFLDSVSILSKLDFDGSGFSLPSGGSRVKSVSISSAEVRLEEPISRSSSDKPKLSRFRSVLRDMFDLMEVVIKMFMGTPP